MRCQKTLVILLQSFFLSSCQPQDNGLTEAEKELLDWVPPKEFKSRYPYYLSGYDRNGSPVIVEEAGRWDYRTTIEADQEENLDKFMAQTFLRWRHLGNSAPGSPGSIVIFDLDGFSVAQVGSARVMQFAVRAFAIFEEVNRKKGLKKLYAINMNYIAEQVYAVGKPFIGSLSNLIDVYGTNPAKWKPVLLREVDASQIPEWYGGFRNHTPIKIYP